MCYPRKMRTSLPLLLALCLLPMSGGCEIVALVGSSAEMLISNTGVSVRGEVIDIEGRPIHAVPVRVQKSRIARPSADMFNPTPYHDTWETRVVDGRFRFSFAGQASVALYFEKPGYYQQLVSVDSTRRRVDRSPHLPSPAIAPWLADPKHSNKRSLRVVLENNTGRPNCWLGGRYNCRSVKAHGKAVGRWSISLVDPGRTRPVCGLKICSIPRNCLREAPTSSPRQSGTSRGARSTGSRSGRRVAATGPRHDGCGSSTVGMKGAGSSPCLVPPASTFSWE